MALSTSNTQIYTRGMIRILIIDHHDLVRMALETRLSTAVGLEIIGSTSEYKEAIQKALRLRPDVILLETKAPNGIKTLETLVENLPQSVILILTSYPDSKEEDTTRHLGASRYLLKTLNTKALVQEIRNSVRQDQDAVHPPVPAVA